MQSILTIAGFDTSGGAGIHADIKTARKLGFHACSAITAITSQNTCKISDIYVVNASVLENQLRAIAEDIRFSAIKIGMVPDDNTARIILKFLENLNVPKVLDPVIRASTGFKIGCVEGYRILMKEIDVLTPNVHEAEEILGISIKDFESAKKAAMKISDRFSLVITGFGGRDVVYDADNKEFHIVGRKFGRNEVHGTGCVYSTALTCYLADGMDLYSACRKARRFVMGAAKRSLKIGKCLPVVNP